MSERLKNVLAERLPGLMSQAGVSRSELAEYCGVSYNTARCWELGIKAPRPEKVVRIAELLNVDPLELMSPAFKDVKPTPVRLLPLVDESGNLVSSDISANYASLSSGIDADYVYIMPDDTMQKADLVKGDVCLIKKSSIIRHGVPMLVKYKNQAFLRFVVMHPKQNIISIRKACPYCESILVDTERFSEEVSVIGYIVSFRRNYKRR